MPHLSNSKPGNGSSVQLAILTVCAEQGNDKSTGGHHRAYMDTRGRQKTDLQGRLGPLNGEAKPEMYVQGVKSSTMCMWWRGLCPLCKVGL